MIPTGITPPPPISLPEELAGVLIRRLLELLDERDDPAALIIAGGPDDEERVKEGLIFTVVDVSLHELVTELVTVTARDSASDGLKMHDVAFQEVVVSCCCSLLYRVCS